MHRMDEFLARSQQREADPEEDDRWEREKEREERKRGDMLDDRSSGGNAERPDGSGEDRDIGGVLEG